MSCSACCASEELACAVANAALASSNDACICARASSEPAEAVVELRASSRFCCACGMRSRVMHVHMSALTRRVSLKSA